MTGQRRLNCNLVLTTFDALPPSEREPFAHWLCAYATRLCLLLNHSCTAPASRADSSSDSVSSQATSSSRVNPSRSH